MFKNQNMNGCSYSDPFIFPILKNVSSKVAMAKDWHVACKSIIKHKMLKFRILLSL